MTAMELDARRMELIRKIMETDSVEVLDKMKQSFNRAVKAAQAKNTDSWCPFFIGRGKAEYYGI